MTPYLLQALAWISLVRLVGFLNESWLLRDLQRELKVFGPIPSAVVLLYFFKIMLSTLEKLLMVVEDP
jgi:spore maturation protein SpmB